jgi:glucose/mannose-6-phosphate isomerase
MNGSDLLKYDISGMCKAYDRWPDIAEEVYEKKNYGVVDFKNIKHVAFAGMGGSGAVGEIFSSILSKSGIHTSIIKSHLLPKTVNDETLVVITSISGNTEESLSIIQEAKKKNIKTIAYSSGGLIKEFCNNNQIKFQHLEKIHSPRTSLPSALYTMLKTLGPQFGISEIEVLNSINQMKKTREKINSSQLNENNPSIKLAEWISGIPVIYYPQGLKAVAIRFKNSLQENSKIHVVTEEVLEACHNGIMSWERTSNMKCVLIRGMDDHSKTKTRLEIIKQYFNEKNISFYEVNSISGDLLSKIINLIFQLDYTSIYHAIMNQSDPSPLKSIEYIKNHMK